MISFFIKSKLYLSNDSMKRWYTNCLDNFINADAFLSISEFSRQDAIKRKLIKDEDSINIKGAGMNYHWEIDSKIEKFNPKKINFRYVLYVGGFDPRKNVELLIKTFSKLNQIKGKI